MSYNEQAKRINTDLKDFFNSPLQQLNERQKEFILNMVIAVGQVAKFRCRSNTAFDGFINQCFQDVAEIKRVQANPGDEWKTLRAFIEEPKTYTEEMNGKEVTRIKKGLNGEESFKEFEKAAQQGKTVCLSDLMINNGL